MLGKEKNTRRIWSLNMAKPRLKRFSRDDLNEGFDVLGEPTHSAILMATDKDGYILFHLLVLSVKRIYPREMELLEAAKAWMLKEGIAWNVPDSEGEETFPSIELPF